MRTPIDARILETRRHLAAANRFPWLLCLERDADKGGWIAITWQPNADAPEVHPISDTELEQLAGEVPSELVRLELIRQ